MMTGDEPVVATMVIWTVITVALAGCAVAAFVYVALS